jgi:hypothetical protein
MTDPKEIVHAIAAHAKWKFYLRQAIDTGTSEWTVDEVRPDNRCEFGTWLRTLSPDNHDSQNWDEVSRLHAEFHKEAAEVLKLALAGRRKEAEAAIAMGSRFTKVSTKLTISMTAWKKALQSEVDHRPSADMRSDDEH